MRRSPARRNEHSARLAAEGCRVFCCPINREAELASVLAAVQPQVCIFDRCSPGLRPLIHHHMLAFMHA